MQEESCKIPGKNCGKCGKHTKDEKHILEGNKCKSPFQKQVDCSGSTRSRLDKIQKNKWECMKCKDPVAYAARE